MSVRIRLFGTPELEADGVSHALAFERRGQLLAFLASKRAWVGRAELAALLWPEQPDKLAFANLRKTLFRLQSPPWHGLVDVDGHAVRVTAASDLSEFESALQAGHHADALALRRGELLAGFDDDGNERWSSWLGFERDRLRAAWRGAALARLDAEIDAGEAVALAARLLDADPFDESALRAQLRWLVASGQGARARQAYAAFISRLSGELGLAPSAALEALRDGLADAAPGAAPRQAPHVAPPPDAGFIGRSVELRRIAALLAQDDCRLLTLLGPGGAGKTRLARRALIELAPRYADGVAFVALEDVGVVAEIGGRLARALGVGLAGSADPLDQVTAYLRERQMLLALDNFEQLAADASLLERLLEACPRLCLVVTSRVRLGLAAEWLLPVEGLPCPEAEDDDRVEAFDAARLFVAAAHRVAPALDPLAHGPAIVDICRHVDGLPLALELAAAWTRVLSCEQIAAGLAADDELLRSADPARPARHASIETVFEHSWRMLAPVERDALARLSIFRGGCTAEAARAVAAASLPVLAALADKSLLRRDEARLQLHPLVQQLAAARLEGEARSAAANAHRRFFRRLLAQLRRRVEIGDREALRQLDADFDNCRLAWEAAIAADDGEALAETAPALFYHCDHRNRFELGVSLLDAALETPAARRDKALEALLRSERAHHEYRLDRYADAEAGAERALAAARAAKHPGALALGLQVLGSCRLRLGRHEDAKRFFEQAREHALDDADPRKAAAILHNLGLAERHLGHPDAALRSFQAAIAAMRSLGDVAGEALCLTNLSLLLSDRGDIAGAVQHLLAGLAICDRHGLVGPKGLILVNLAALAIEGGDDAAAQRYARSALAMEETRRNRYLFAFLKLQLARIALRRGELDEARRELEASLRIAAVLGRCALIVEDLRCIAEIVGADGAPEVGQRILRFLADHPDTESAERTAILSQLEGAPATPPWNGPGIDELVQRVLVETAAGYAPLVASLRAGR